MGIALTGGASLMPGVVDTATRVLETPSRLEMPRGVGGMVDSVANPIYATSVGLVLYAARHRVVNQADGHNSGLIGVVVNGVADWFRKRKKSR
jgi:cell division protein FtsA